MTGVGVTHQQWQVRRHVSPGVNRCPSSLYSQRQPTNADYSAPCPVTSRHGTVIPGFILLSCRVSGSRRLKCFSFSLRLRFIRLQNTVRWAWSVTSLHLPVHEVWIYSDVGVICFSSWGWWVLKTYILRDGLLGVGELRHRELG